MLVKPYKIVERKTDTINLKKHSDTDLNTCCELCEFGTLDRCNSIDLLGFDCVIYDTQHYSYFVEKWNAKITK